MPRKGQRLKHRKAVWPKPALPKRQRPDPLAGQPLLPYMTAHFEWMRVHGYSEDTIRARRVAIRRFITPASEITLPKLPKHLPRVILSAQEVESILREAEPTNAQGLRDRAMLETLYSTGLRRMELPALAVYDVDLTRRLVIVREGKGRRDRVIPIGARAAAWVEKYLLEARPQLLIADCETLFLTDYGEPMSPEYLSDRVRRYMHFAGIHKPGACHLFRHACATHMLENGADTRFIQAMLGHADLSTTQIYTHVSIDKLREIHDATHPARMSKGASTVHARDAVPATHARAERDALWTSLAAEADDEAAE
jgi:integrase/recombinase XerD